MATKKKTDEAAPIVWDPSETVLSDDLFDSWNEEKEQAAIAAAAAAADVKHIIIGGNIFAGRFPDGTIVQGPLTFSVADLEAVTTEADNPVDQLKALFRRIGSEESADELDGQNLSSVVIYAEKFFSTFSRIAEVALGKSITS